MTREESIDILNELKKYYLGEVVDALNVATDALKAQELVEPVFERIFMPVGDALLWVCGKCGHHLTSSDWYCANCGRAVKWDG